MLLRYYIKRYLHKSYQGKRKKEKSEVIDKTVRFGEIWYHLLSSEFWDTVHPKAHHHLLFCTATATATATATVTGNAIHRSVLAPSVIRLPPPLSFFLYLRLFLSFFSFFSEMFFSLVLHLYAFVSDRSSRWPFSLPRLKI